MGDVLSLISSAGSFIFYGPLGWLARFAYWFYLEVIPFVLQYIAIPMFVLGILVALAFAGGTLLFTIVFVIVMYFYIKKALFDSKPVKLG